MSQRRWNNKVLKPIVFYGTILAVVYFANQYIARALYDIRSTFEHMPVGVVWPVYIIVNVLRITLILPYYIAPLGSFVMWYFMVTLGIETAAIILIWSWILQAAIYIPAIRKLWTHRIELILESEKDLWWFPGALKQALLAVDGWWKDWIIIDNERTHAQIKKITRQSALVFIMETSYFVGGIVPEVWIATRTPIPIWLYVPTITAAFWLLYPLTKIYGRAMVEVTSKEDGNILEDLIYNNIEGFLSLKWWEVILSVVVPVLSTIYLHGHHGRIFFAWLIRWCRGETRDSTSMADEQECAELQPVEEVMEDENQTKKNESLTC